jgi:phage tail sheath protein FI
MAERIVSPGVFTNEVDQSFLAGGVAQIGAAIIGPTVKGPALIPTQITSFGQFQEVFGPTTTDSYVPYVVQDYLAKGGNVITVTRLLYEDGYKLTNGGLAVIAKSGSGASAVQVVTHVLHPTQAVTTDGATALFEDSVIQNDSSGSFAIKLSGSYAAGADSAIGFSGAFLATEGTAISASIVSTSNEYISKVFQRDPKSVNYPVYVQYENINASSLFNNLADVTIELAKLSNYEFLQDYQTANTPWITSQKIGSVTRNLFRFHTLSHGTAVNYETKVGIRDIKLGSETPDPNGYGSFTVEIRRVNTTTPAPGLLNSPYASNDTDASPDIVETFINVNLDPTSPNYIARRIGNRYQTVNDSNQLLINGDYPNISKYVRVEVDVNVADRLIDPALVPFGFRALSTPIPMASGSLNISAASYSTSQVVSSAFNSNNYFGFNFAVQNNLNYLAPIPTSGSNTGSNSDFYLGDVSQNAEAGFPSIATAYSGSLQTALNAGTLTTNVATATRKFILPFQGGFDGAKPNLKKYAGQYIAATNTFGFDCSTATSTGTKAYNKAFTLLTNADYYDMNMLVTPGVIDSLHPYVTGLARSLAETRQDTFYVMDTNALTDSINAAVNQVISLDSNYTAAYWPWLRIPGANNIPTWVPPSTLIPGVLAFNDNTQAPWYAPAGLNRGLITATDTYLKLSQSDRDTLYEARINPIANFLNDGIVVWGQKTLQARPSALDRVNVRRLLIAVKKFIASSTRYLVFEQNTNATRNRFLSIVNPYMEQVRANQGLYAFRVVMDQTNNTPDLIDQNILYGQIFLQPTRTAEFIILDFNIQPTGATFPE